MIKVEPEIVKINDFLYLIKWVEIFSLIFLDTAIDLI